PDDRYQTCRELLQDLARIRKISDDTTTEPSVLVPVSVEAIATPAATTMRVTGRRHWRWLPWLVAGSLLLSTGAGAALAWLRLMKQPSTAPANGLAADDGNVEAIFSKQRHEQFLKEAVEQYADPGNDPTRIRNGLNHGIELGLHYLDQWRLD